MATRKIVGPILDFEINPASIGAGLTQSEMQCWDNCAEKWYLGYNLMLTKTGKFSWALQYGTWFHSFLEEYYSTKGKRWSWNPHIDAKEARFLPQKTLAEREKWEGIGRIQSEVYASHYKGDFVVNEFEGTEAILEYEFEEILLKGMIDLHGWSQAFKGIYIWDHKTSGRLDRGTVLGWDFRLQFMFYMWLYTKVYGKDGRRLKGCIINAIKKPQLKQGEHEPLSAYLQRVQSDMLARDETYFYRERLILKKGDLEHFENNILRPKIERVKMIMDPKVPATIKYQLVRNKNTDTCIKYGNPCEFMAVCKHGLETEKHAFRKREIKHQELVEETL